MMVAGQINDGSWPVPGLGNWYDIELGSLPNLVAALTFYSEAGLIKDLDTGLIKDLDKDLEAGLTIRLGSLHYLETALAKDLGASLTIGLISLHELEAACQRIWGLAQHFIWKLA